MNYDFFADKQDKINVLEFIFNETDLRIYDLASAYGHHVCEYKLIDEIVSKFDMEGSFLTFQLWSPRHGSQPTFRRIELNPKYCKGYTFRYNTEGFGLVQLYFDGVRNNQLSHSHIGHFNEKGAAKLESNPFDKTSNWDWNEIKKTSNKLKYHIHNKLAVSKMGSSGVLAGAKELQLNGIKL